MVYSLLYWSHDFTSSKLDDTITFVFINCVVKVRENNLYTIMTQYGIKHFRTYPGRSAKCYVNPLNDLFRLPTITIQR